MVTSKDTKFEIKKIDVKKMGARYEPNYGCHSY